MSTFSGLFKRYRLKGEFASLNELANELAQKVYLYEPSIFSHWQNGKRVPTKRAVLLMQVTLFTERGAIRTVQEANEFLESAKQGYLTNNEQKSLFKTSYVIS